MGVRSAYGFSAAEVVQAFRAFVVLPGVAVEDASLLARALDWSERGLDFADAPHLARAQGCSAFMSFDRTLARAATPLSEVKVVSP
jgi:predicted nucleic acid-binding protein